MQLGCIIAQSQRLLCVCPLVRIYVIFNFICRKVWLLPSFACFVILRSENGERKEVKKYRN